MKLKKKKIAKRCAYCVSFRPNRCNGGTCVDDGTKIEFPHESVCVENRFEPMIKSRKSIIMLKDDAMKRLQAGLSAEKEKALMDAISYCIGSEQWSLAEAEGRCSTVIEQDGSEVFSFNDQEVLRIDPPRLMEESGSNKTVVSQQIHRLYGRAGSVNE